MLFILEIFLIFYNPIESRVRGDKIVLPVNKEYIIKNHSIDRLDKVIIHTKNSLGFRGENPPHEFGKYLSIIAIGGSTTECKYLSDGKTWTDVLLKNLGNNFDSLWVNNAGLDGHSTFGHIMLMKDYVLPLKPKIVLLLIGVNDIGRQDIGRFDLINVRDKIDLSSIEAFIMSASSYSETFVLLLNLYRYHKSERTGLGHREVDLKKIQVLESSETMAENTVQDMAEYVNGYEVRLSRVIKISKENGIDPILITQPALFGYGLDDITGVDLARIRVENKYGGLSWDILETYNDVTRKIGQKENILVIDLAKELPKSSGYFYDFYHFTNEGAQKVGDIIYYHLSQYLKIRYSEYVQQ
jgi:lysophospholipase L1-like esterase